MPRKNETILYGFFGTLCLIWGLTWIPLKLGLEYVPPNLFAAVRFTLAGALLLLIFWGRHGFGLVKTKDFLLLSMVAVLMTSLTYGFLYYGVAHISSGLSALLNLTFIPIFLLIIGFALKQETLTLAKLAGITLGTLGLAFLFLFDLEGSLDTETLLGSAAVIAASLVYCLGSVLARPLLKAYSPLLISGQANFIGGLYLFFAAYAVGPVNPQVWDAFSNQTVLLSLAFLVVFGSLIAFTIYLKLIRDWSPVKAGMYSFISPIVAVSAGVIFLEESFDAWDFLGMVFMLAGAVLILFSRSKRKAGKGKLAGLSRPLSPKPAHQEVAE